MIRVRILQKVNVNGWFTFGIALLIFPLAITQNNHRQNPTEAELHADSFVGEKQRLIDTLESRAVPKDIHANPPNVPPPVFSQQEPPSKRTGGQNTRLPEGQQPPLGRPPVTDEHNVINRDHRSGNIGQASQPQNSHPIPNNQDHPPNARFQEMPSGPINGVDNNRHIEIDRQRNVKDNSMHGASPQLQNPEVNRAPVQNGDHRVTGNPTQATAKSEDTRGTNRDQNGNREHPAPPHHHPGDMNFAPDSFNQFRHDRMPHDDRLPIDQGSRRSRTDIPREFLLEEILSFPSVTIDSDGRPNHMPIGNDFTTLTVLVTPGVKECYFYTPITHFRVDYQVIRGGGLDLGLFVKDPDGQPIAIRPPVPDASIVINVPPHFQMMPYAICLDNRKASYSEKQTYLSVDLELNWDNPDSYERSAIEFLQRKYTSNSESEAAVSQYIENLKNFMAKLDGLHGRLRRIEHLQQRSDNFGYVDKALMEANLDRVTQGSIIQIIVMLGVAGLQILLIRSLFDPNSRIYGFWIGKRPSSRARC